MKKLRILVLMHEQLVPPESAKGYSDKELVDWKTEFDVMAGLSQLGHEVIPLGVGSDLATIRNAIEDKRPHIVFNLMEEFHNVPVYDHYVAGYLELLRQPYSGCNPRGLMLARDKALSKKILSYHRIKTPAFAVFPLGKTIRRPKRLQFPLLVKSLTVDGSAGVAQASIVHNDDKLKERVAYLHESLGTDVIAEEYIVGREVYVPIIGNRRLLTLPIVELVFGKLAEGAEPIATSKVKWDWEYQKKRGIELILAKDIPEEVDKRIRQVGKRVFRALDLTGYGRVDLRLTEEGEVYVIEANPNADIGYGEELAEAAEAVGISYPKLLQRILNLGLAYQAEWRQAPV